jgi:hypothetical protein
VDCYVVRKPTRQQVLAKQNGQAELKRGFNRNPKMRNLATLEAIYAMYPEPLVGQRLAQAYLELGRKDDALGVLLEVSHQEAKAIYEAEGIQVQAVNEARRMFARLRKRSAPLLILEVKGSAVPIAVWFDTMDGRRRCSKQLDLRTGSHKVFFQRTAGKSRDEQPRAARSFKRQQAEEQVHTIDIRPSRPQVHKKQREGKRHPVR